MADERTEAERELEEEEESEHREEHSEERADDAEAITNPDGHRDREPFVNEGGNEDPAVADDSTIPLRPRCETVGHVRSAQRPARHHRSTPR